MVTDNLTTKIATKLATKLAIKPEIMSPAGYWPQLQAAIEAGADAVYFGLKHFTARAKVGFSLTELPEVMRVLHRRGVKGYVTFNTLVFDHELNEAAKTIAAIAQADADAIIVQDIGIAQLAHRIAPQLELHGSTQMSITSAEGIKLAQRFGICRVVMARELSLEDILAIRAQTDCQLEIFVHGALCVSYSGQCFSSEAWGGRSANRGQCAQACRLPYEMIVDEQLKPLGDARYLLSPGDLFALHQIPEIVKIGISALKIEGRYKDENYVALTTRAYRKAVDEACADLPLSADRVAELQLEQVYSRGLGAYFITGTDHQKVVEGRTPRHRGVLMGRVLQVLADSVVIAPDEGAVAAPLKAGDGLVFDAADWRSPQEPEEGGNVYHVKPLKAGQIKIQFGNGAIDFTRIKAGDLVWRTHDPELDKIARPYTQAAAPVHKQPVQVRLIAHEGKPLIIEWRLSNQPSARVVVQSDKPLMAAQNRALNIEFAREQLSRLGNTPYQLTDLELDINGQPFAPSSLLNELRRQAVDKLSELQSRPRSIVINDPQAALNERLAQAEKISDATTAIAPQLHLLARRPEQLEAAIDLQNSLPIASITLDYLDLYGLRPAIEKLQSLGITARVASPRILKPDEHQIIDFLVKLECQIVVRSNGLLQVLQDIEHQPLIGDFSLNAANILSADTFLRMGLLRLTPTHDLNAAQIANLSRQIGADRIEVIAYQHLPVFHTEHCVFCRFLSDGTSYKDCGQPCENHRVELRDLNGRAHPVMADVGCRNTVYGAEAQEASRYLNEWLNAGIIHYRLEFVHESAAQVEQIASAFSAALHGKLSNQELANLMQQLAPQGSTEGSLFVPLNYRSLPLLQ
jgi:putative protease